MEHRNKYSAHPLYRGIHLSVTERRVCDRQVCHTVSIDTFTHFLLRVMLSVNLQLHIVVMLCSNEILNFSEVNLIFLIKMQENYSKKRGLLSFLPNVLY